MKIVLAYSGGLDTSVCIKWLEEKYDAEVITLTMELGQESGDLREIEEKAKKLGAVKTYSIDAQSEFVENYINPAIWANGLYEGKYPLATALGRPLIGKWMVDIAHKEGADAVAHGSTGKGNDQVRLDVTVKALDPKLKVIAPVRQWPMTREEEINYAREHDIQIPVTVDDPYSYDTNLWGKSAEAGPLEDPMNEPKEACMQLTAPPEQAPDEPHYVSIDFHRGLPVALDEKVVDEVELIKQLNQLAGAHGVGRIDMIEDRLVGIKSRETYECPAATVILEAHKELERLCLTREQNSFKPALDQKWGELVYYGLWYEPLKDDIQSFIENTQKYVTGKVRLKLYKGSCTVVGRESPQSLYDLGLATYDKGDSFDHTSAEGFINIWGLPSRTSGERKKR
ncbi:MAG: argininosuccinate synthase [Candidatus Altiarchaeales archaeon]|nr:argininosuccinate synthase [Candidatus Altiarchaeales archaeon]